MHIFNFRAINRISKIKNFLIENNISSVILAGGGLLSDFDDLDLFADSSDSENSEAFRLAISAIKFNTFNAASTTINGIKVQLCKYKKDSLKSLVDSFDFAHCQIGVKLSISKNGNITANESYISDNFKEAMIQQTTWYVGSEYPIASLIRLFKIKDKIKISRVDLAGNTIKILNDIYTLKLLSYEDFKNQLDAVDLNLNIESISGYENDCLRLFKNLQQT